jgi:hypothetical protein
LIIAVHAQSLIPGLGLTGVTVYLLDKKVHIVVFQPQPGDGNDVPNLGRPDIVILRRGRAGAPFLPFTE